jgi:hypothetical protein
MAKYTFKSNIFRNFSNVPGWRTNRKIVVIESDDWGSIRMPSKQVYDDFLKADIMVDHDSYCKYDSLESETDLADLFDVLTSIKDQNGNHPVLTANTVVANPDFDKIKESDFLTYHYEVFTESLKRYPNHTRVFDLYKEGMKNKIFYPQFHGREHINIALWMQELRKKDQITLMAFNAKSFGIPYMTDTGMKTNYMKAFDFKTPEEKEQKKVILTEGLHIFEKLFGFHSKSFTPPSYTWHSDFNSHIAERGVLYFQGIPFQFEPSLQTRFRHLRKFHYCGEHNKYSQIYLIRNCHFEPSHTDAVDWIDECMHRINTAFKWKKPAVISTHRLNFIGSIDPANSSRNLRLFKTILSFIKKKWPDIEFMTSDQLGDLINWDKLYFEKYYSN